MKSALSIALGGVDAVQRRAPKRPLHCPRHPPHKGPLFTVADVVAAATTATAQRVRVIGAAGGAAELARGGLWEQESDTPARLAQLALSTGDVAARDDGLESGLERSGSFALG